MSSVTPDQTSGRTAESSRQAEFENLFEFAPIAYFVMDQSGAIIEVNHAGSRMLDSDRAHLHGAEFAHFVPAEDQKVFLSHIGRVFETGHAQSNEIQIRLRSGHTVWGRFESRPHTDRSGRLVCLTGVIDVSDRKKIEDDLILARENAVKANRVKSEFLANMSHEIRTPMNGILSVGQLLHATPLSDEQRRYVDTIVASSAAVLAIMNDIVDYSRIEENRLTLDKRPFSMRHVVQSTVEVFRPLSSSKGLRFAYQLDGGADGWFDGDAGRIQQIIYNLVGNAIKYTEKGAVEMVVTRKDLSEFLCEITFEVRDTGPGLSDEQQRVVRESRVQAGGDDRFRKPLRGTGLGIAIVKSLARLMGGQFYFSSVLGHGSSFFFSVPLHMSNDDAALENEQIVAADAAEPPAAARILIAEDNEINQLVLQTILEKGGHSVAAVNDGSEVLAALRDERYDIVFMDISMPEMDGIEATKRIRNGEAGPLNSGVYIVAITAHSMKGDKETFLEAGLDDYISKPFAKDNVLTRVAEILAAKHAGGR